jgi:hypothetical protein
MSAVVNLPRAYKALDMPCTFTHFKNLAAQAKPERELERFRDLVDRIEQTQAKDKASLPLLSFARYGNERTPKGSYRHDANVVSVTAISGDHDAGTMTLEEARSRLAAFDIAAVLHTTPSHTASAPRWRVFCPLILCLIGRGGKRGCDQYRHFVAQLNGILGGALAAESFALSQSYYYGHVEGVEYHVAVVDGANTLDSPDSFNFGSAQPIYPDRKRDETPSAGDARKPRDNTPSAGKKDNTRSGKAARLARQMKSVNRETYVDFCDAVDVDPELSAWREENRIKQGSDRQMSRVWNLIEAPPDYDDIFDTWREPSRFQLTRFLDIKMNDRRRYIVKGLIPREGLVVAWGPPKCGKSFWITDVALHVALGWEYRGRRVEPGAVVYVACEGQAGVPQRIEAFKQTRLAEKPETDPPFYLLPTQLNLIGESKKLIEEIAAQLRDEKPIMVVLDTLNRSLVGSESKDEDMSAYIAACEAIRAAFNCAVVIIHHCGIEGTRPRGHTSLTGAVDAQIAIRRNGATIARVEWMKDGDEGDEIVSVLEKVVVGTDEDGEEITSCVVEPCEPEPFDDSAQLRGGELAALAILRELATRGRVLDTEWRAACVASGKLARSDNPETHGKAYERARKGLTDKRAVKIAGRYI